MDASCPLGNHLSLGNLAISHFFEKKRRHLELLDLLGQGERSVDELAQEAGLTLANASAHLQVLRQARMVESDKRGLQVVYRLGAPEVFQLWRTCAISEQPGWPRWTGWSRPTLPTAPASMLSTLTNYGRCWPKVA